MTTVFRLFFFRVKKEWQYQYSVWKTAVDWIVWLYILLPILIFVSYQYYLLWGGQANWVALIPDFLFSYVLFFLVCWFGTIRLFLQFGDLLVIRQHEDWLRSLMKLGIFYTIGRNTFYLAFISLLLLPVWVVYEGMGYNEIFLFVCFVFVFQLFIQLV